MAVKKNGKDDKVKLDDFELDDFDFDIPEFDESPPKDDRKPITRMGSGFFKGVVASSTNPSNLINAMRMATPKGYSQALNVAEGVGDSVKELYNIAADDLKPLTDSIRRSADKLAPKLKGKIPNFLVKGLEKMSLGEDRGVMSAQRLKQDYQNGEISGVLGTIFKTQADAQYQEKVRDESTRMVREGVEDQQHGEQLKQLNYVARGISRLVGYQDQVLAEYQKKSLELQYRHYFVAKDMLDITNVHQDKMQKAMADLVKNTALPEAVKIQKSELAKQMISQKLVAGGINTISNFTQNYRQNLTKNAGNFIRGITAPLGAMGGMAGAGGMEGMDVDKSEMAGYAAGNALSSAAMERGAIMLRPYIEGNKFVAKGNNFLRQNLIGGPQKLDRWAKSETKGTGAKATFIQTLKDIAPKFYLNDKVGENQLMSNDKAAIFDQRTHRTINEIIPYYLSSINKWAKAAVTGDANEEREVYNMTSASFTSKGKARKDALGAILPADQSKVVRQQLNEYIDGLDPDKNLSKSARTALTHQMLGDVASGKHFDATHYTKREAYNDKLADETIDELRIFFRNSYDLDHDGNSQNNSQEAKDRSFKHAEGFDRLQSMIPDTGNRIRTLMDAVGRDNLRELGLITGEGRRERIDYQKVWELMLDENAGGSPPGGDPGPAPGPAPAPGPRGRGRVSKRRRGRPSPAPRGQDDQGFGPQPDRTETVGSGFLDELKLVTQAVKDNSLVAQMGRHLELMEVLTQKAIDGFCCCGDHGEGSPIPGGSDESSAAAVLGGKKGGRFKGLVGRGIKGTAKGVWGLTKGYAKLTGKAYMGVGKLGMWGAKKSLGLGFGAAKGLFRRKLDGIYSALDENKPLLDAKALKAKQYIDVKTGKIITSVKDITGEVKDAAGETVVTAEQYAQGLKDKYGKSIAGGIAGLAGKAVGLYANVATAPYRMAFKAAGSLARGILNRGRDQIHDGYLKGSDRVRVEANKLKAGEYFDGVTGKAVTRYEDIKNGLKDKAGDWVVRAEEIREAGGFKDVTGKAVGKASMALSALKMAGRAYVGMAMLPLKLMGGAMRAVTGGLRGALRGKLPGFGRSKTVRLSGDAANDQVMLNYHQLSIQDKILTLLEQGQKKTFGDSDGDGVRDNSWKDILRKRKEKKEKEAAEKAEAGKKGGGGLLGGLGGMLAGLFKRKKDDDEDDDDGSLLSDAADVADIADSVGDAKERRRGRRGRGGRAGRAANAGKKGLLRRGAGAAWNATKFVGRNVLRPAASFLGRQVLMRGAMWAGTALAGVLSAPVVLGALAAGAVAYGGYKLYKHFADKPTPIRGMRYAQYGANPRDEKQFGPMIEMEKRLAKAVQYPKDELATLNERDLNPIELLGLFEIDGQKPEDNKERIQGWLQWFTKRFKPVYLAHMTAINNMAQGTNLQELDEKLDVSLGQGYVKATRLDQLKDAYNDTDNSPFDDDLDSDADDVESWADDANKHYAEKSSQVDTKTKLEAMKGTGTSAALAAAQAVSNNQSSQSIASAKAAPEKKGFFSEMADKMKKMSLAEWAGGAMGGLIGGSAGAKWLSGIMGKIFPKPPSISDGLEPAIAIRCKIYGMKELEVGKVSAIQRMEELLWPSVKYQDGAATFDGKAQSIYTQVSAYFNTGGGQMNSTDWATWFRYRALPVFLQYCTSVRSFATIDAKDAHTKLKGEDLSAALAQTSATVSNYEDTEIPVWEVTISPWPGYELNKDPESVAKEITALAGAVSKKTYTNNVMQLITPQSQNSGPASASNPLRTNNEEAPSPLAGYRDGSLTQNGGILARTGKAFEGGGPAANTPFYAAGMSNGMPVVMHPGGGAGGDINNVPMPKGNGWANVKDTILAAAQMTGFDPAIAATTAAIESGFRPFIKSSTSSATGLFQFIDSTWQAMLKKYGPKYGMAPNTPSTDARANSILGMEYMKENAQILEKAIGRKVTDTDIYMAHFLGSGGAKKFLKAPPNDPGTRWVGDNVPRANASIFFNNGRPRTVSEVYNLMGSKLEKGRKMHDLTAGMTPPAVAPAGQQQATPEGSTSAADSSGGYTAGGFGPEQSSAPTGAGTTGVMAAPSGGSSPSTTLGGGAAPAMGAGTTGVMAAGSQSTSTTGLTTPPAPDPTQPTPEVQAAMAAKQSSRENGQINESVSSVTEVLNKSLEVHLSSGQTLLEILEELRKRGGADLGQQPPKQTVPSTSRAQQPAQQMPSAPIGVLRNRN